MSGRPLRRRAASPHRRRHPGGLRRRPARPAARARRRDARPGHHDRRDQERLRAHRRRRGPRACGWPREVTPETTFLGAHVVPPDTPDAPDDYVALVTGPMLDACAPHARWIDVFCEPVGARLRRRRGPRRADRRARPPGWSCGCTPTSSPPGRACGWRSSSARPAPTTAPTSTDADVDALAGGDTVATLLPGVEFSTRSPYPDARRLLDAGVDVALATDCNPGQLLHLVDGRSASRSPSARCG